MTNASGRAGPSDNPLMERIPGELFLNGSEVKVRYLSLADESGVTEFFQSLSEQTLSRRFFRTIKLTRAQIAYLCLTDLRSCAGIAAVMENVSGSRIIGLGHFFRVEPACHGEIALVVADDWQNMGLGGHLLHHLLIHAADHGVSTVTADVQTENKAMQKLIKNCGFPAPLILCRAVYHYRIDLTGFSAENDLINHLTI